MSQFYPDYMPRQTRISKTWWTFSWRKLARGSDGYLQCPNSFKLSKISIMTPRCLWQRRSCASQSGEAATHQRLRLRRCLLCLQILCNLVRKPVVNQADPEIPSMCPDDLSKALGVVADESTHKELLQIFLCVALASSSCSVLPRHPSVP
mmetsp:Transcript_19903/g.75212  ORF Transcript_19903/g.75212 Transcript_19903/m.75212 type:complete len:150 (+) Transcript_19903:474-923(+)